MSHASTVTLSEALEQEIHEFMERHPEESTLSDLIHKAVRQYLALKTLESESVFMPSRRTLHVTPAIPGSGISDVSKRHDDYLADVLPE